MEPANRPALLVAAALAVASAFVVVGTLQTGVRPRAAAVELESAILPPYNFRRWVESNTRMSNDPHLDVPMDRFAGRGDHSQPTKMPRTRAQMELSEARKDVEETTEAIQPMLDAVEEQLQSDPRNATLLAQKEEYEAAIAKASEGLQDIQAKVNDQNKDLVQGRARARADVARRAQAKVNDQNKDLVQGRARWANKANYLGGSDHFVPLEQAQSQLAGGGYGHRYSIVDWLDGE